MIIISCAYIWLNRNSRPFECPRDFCERPRDICDSAKGREIFVKGREIFVNYKNLSAFFQLAHNFEKNLSAFLKKNLSAFFPNILNYTLKSL